MKKGSITMKNPVLLARITGAVAVLLGLLASVGASFIPASIDPGHNLVWVGGLLAVLPVLMLARAGLLPEGRDDR